MSKKKWLGYVIANENEEFLHSFKADNFHTITAWTRNPALAFRHKTSRLCQERIKRLNGKNSLWEMELLETDSHFLVGSSSENVPPWIVKPSLALLP